MFYCLNHLLEKNIISSSKTTRQRIFTAHLPERENGNIYVAHNPRDLQLTSQSPHEDILILMIRNYRECFIRNSKQINIIMDKIEYESSFNILDNTTDLDLIYNFNKNHYFHNLRCFDRWNSQKKIIIYYEDLIQNPREVFREVLSFLNVSDIEKRINAFFEDFEAHFQKSIEIYKAQGGSQSKGVDILYHTKKFGYENSKIIDELVKYKFPNYFKKYLIRYELNEQE